METINDDTRFDITTIAVGSIFLIKKRYLFKLEQRQGNENEYTITDTITKKQICISGNDSTITFGSMKRELAL
jgi:hypothetical protein